MNYQLKAEIAALEDQLATKKTQMLEMPNAHLIVDGQKLERFLETSNMDCKTLIDEIENRVRVKLVQIKVFQTSDTEKLTKLQRTMLDDFREFASAIVCRSVDVEIAIEIVQSDAKVILLGEDENYLIAVKKRAIHDVFILVESDCVIADLVPYLLQTPDGKPLYLDNMIKEARSYSDIVAFSPQTASPKQTTVPKQRNAPKKTNEEVTLEKCMQIQERMVEWMTKQLVEYGIPKGEFFACWYLNFVYDYDIKVCDFLQPKDIQDYIQVGYISSKESSPFDRVYQTFKDSVKDKPFMKGYTLDIGKPEITPNRFKVKITAQQLK